VMNTITAKQTLMTTRRVSDCPKTRLRGLSFLDHLQHPRSGRQFRRLRWRGCTKHPTVVPSIVCSCSLFHAQPAERKANHGQRNTENKLGPLALAVGSSLSAAEERFRPRVVMIPTPLGHNNGSLRAGACTDVLPGHLGLPSAIVSAFTHWLKLTHDYKTQTLARVTQTTKQRQENTHTHKHANTHTHANTQTSIHTYTHTHTHDHPTEMQRC